MLNVLRCFWLRRKSVAPDKLKCYSMHFCFKRVCHVFRQALIKMHSLSEFVLHTAVIFYLMDIFLHTKIHWSDKRKKQTLKIHKMLTQQQRSKNVIKKCDEVWLCSFGENLPICICKPYKACLASHTALLLRLLEETNIVIPFCSLICLCFLMESWWKVMIFMDEFDFQIVVALNHVFVSLCFYTWIYTLASLSFHQFIRIYYVVYNAFSICVIHLF